MQEFSIVRQNLMDSKDYRPYCGNNKCTGNNPRTQFLGEQFHCPICGWISQFPKDFIQKYKEKYNLS